MLHMHTRVHSKIMVILCHGLECSHLSASCGTVYKKRLISSMWCSTPQSRFGPDSNTWHR